MLGIGSVFPGATEANVPKADTVDVATLRLDGDKIYLSQGGSAFEELALGDTPEARHLRKLLEDAGSGTISAPVGSFIVANGGSGASGNKPSTAESTSGAAKKEAQAVEEEQCSNLTAGTWPRAR